MANLTVVAADIAPAMVVEQMTGPAGAAITKGQAVRLDTTTGRFVLAQATTAPNARACGIAITPANAAGQTITVVRKGWIAAGSAIAALAFDADVFLSDTAGTLNDAAGTVSKVLGTVVPGWAETAGSRLLRIDL